MWVIRHNIVDGVYFKTQILLGTLDTQKSTSGGFLCILSSRTFAHISWKCKKQTSVSHSSTESDIISLDAGLQMDRVRALGLWDVVMEVLRSTNNTKTPTHPASGNSKWSAKAEVQWWDICQEPTELRLTDCSTESIWITKIQIKNVDTKNHLLRLLNVMNFSMFSCSRFFLSNWKQSAMSKRGQEGPSRVVSAMAKPSPMNLVSHNLSSTRKNCPQDMSDSNNPVNAKAEQGGVSTSVWKQMRGVETHMNGSKMEFRNMQILNHQCLGKVFQILRKKLDTTENSSKLGIEAIKTSVLMWGLFMSSATKAVIHLGPNYTENLEVFKNTNFEEIQSSFGITQRLMLEHSDEISTAPSWTRSTLSHDQVIKCT